MSDESGHDPAAVRSRWFVPALIVGWLVIGFGVSRAVVDAHDAKPFTVAAFVVAFDLLHDVVLVPLLLAGGSLIGRIVPVPARGAVRAATAVSLLVVVFAAPLIGRLGARPSNSSILPLPYVRNTLIVLAGIWVVTAVVVVRRARRAATAHRAAAPRRPATTAR